MAEERGDGNAEEDPSEEEDSQEEHEVVRHLHNGKTPSPPSALANQEAEASTADEVVEQQLDQHLVEEVVKRTPGPREPTVEVREPTARMVNEAQARAGTVRRRRRG